MSSLHREWSWVRNSRSRYQIENTEQWCVGAGDETRNLLWPVLGNTRVFILKQILHCMFKCKWFKCDSRCMVTENNITNINITSEAYKDDQFILASQAKQVFYVKDLSSGPNWRVAARQLSQCLGHNRRLFERHRFTAR